MLKSTIIKAVQTAKTALQDLAVDGTVTTRVVGRHIPGVAPRNTEAVYAVKIVLTRFDSKEIDDDRILSSDLKALVFPFAIIPAPNDTVEIGTDRYRIIDNNKVMAGDEVALSQLQLRII